MRSDKMPTRREGEASSNTAVCAAKTVKKTACCGCWRFWPTAEKQNPSNKKPKPERARVERWLTGVGAGSFVRPAWRWASAGGRANGCAPASRLSRLHTLHRSSRSCIAASSLGGWLCSMNRETSFLATLAVFGSRCPWSCRACHSPAGHVVETRGVGTLPNPEKPLRRIHLLSDRRCARVTHSALFSSSSETVRSTFGPLHVSHF